MRDPVFVHVPRTGGTSIRHALRLGTGELHVPARVLRDRMGAAAWEAAFTFAFVRDPWARALSLFMKLTESRFANWLGFREWVREGCPAPEHAGISASAPMAEFLTDSNGDLIVEFVGRFEELDGCWRRIMRRLEGWPHGVPARLPVVDATRFTALSAWYDGPTASAVGQLYRRDVELFGYAEPELWLTDPAPPT